MQQPSISVIMIVRNGERHIAEALASIRLSKVTPLEVLVLDGGSTDRTREIAGAFEEVTVVPQASIGIANAYNEAIGRARGDVLAFLSADDRWLPRKLDRHLEALAPRPDLLATVSLVEHFLDGDAPANFRLDLLARAVPGFLMEALVARRAAFERVGPFDASFSTAEDTDWFARARDLGVEIELIPEVLVEKRVHGTNSSLNDPLGQRNRLRAIRASITRKRSTE